MRPIYIVGTARHVGKTTMTLGLLHAFRERGLKVSYVKPLGQRVGGSAGAVLHDDARVVARFLGQNENELAEMAVPLPSGRVEKEIGDLQTRKLLDKIVADHETLAEKYDVVMIESMGHVAMGSCLGLSSADVARSLNAKVLLISEGGIGRAIDAVSLCETFITAHGADFMGVVFNKIWPAKYTRVKAAATKGVANLHIKTYGAVPFEDNLASPTMRQIYDHLGGELLGGDKHLQHRVQHTIVAAMEARHMISYIERCTLVVVPGDRTDNILASLRIHMMGGKDSLAVAGLILTCGYRPDKETMDAIKSFHLPVILVEGDTYTVASNLRNTIFKLTPDDKERIQWAVCLVAEYVDIDGIIDALAD